MGARKLLKISCVSYLEAYKSSMQLNDLQVHLLPNCVFVGMFNYSQRMVVDFNMKAFESIGLLSSY